MLLVYLLAVMDQSECCHKKQLHVALLFEGGELRIDRHDERELNLNAVERGAGVLLLL
jgi:hypothetical protein